MKAFSTAALFALCLAAPAAPLLAQERPDYTAVSAETQSVGEAYFDAYIARDWGRLEPLLADNASFLDPTADLVFGGAQVDGKAAMMTFFREGYAGITRMSVSPVRAIHSGHYAIFETELDWAMMMSATQEVASVMPFVVVLRIEDGRVVSHRDYADYAPFIAAARSSRQ
jgi:ketosteroid isomerase-like protein